MGVSDRHIVYGCESPTQKIPYKEDSRLRVAGENHAATVSLVKLSSQP